jgi:hypothetical protein
MNEYPTINDTNPNSPQLNYKKVLKSPLIVNSNIVKLEEPYNTKPIRHCGVDNVG